MSAGMAYEAMNNAGALKSKLIVILNDNKMSSQTSWAMSKYLANFCLVKYILFKRTIKLITSAFSKI